MIFTDDILELMKFFEHWIERQSQGLKDAKDKLAAAKEEQEQVLTEYNKNLARLRDLGAIRAEADRGMREELEGSGRSVKGSQSRLDEVRAQLELNREARRKELDELDEKIRKQQEKRLKR